MNPQIPPIFNRAVQDFQGGNLVGAAAGFKRVVDIDDQIADAHHFLGIIYGILENQQKAIDHLLIAVRLKPDDGVVQFNTAKALMESGFDEGALEHHKKATEMMRDNLDAWVNYGASLQKLNKYEDALDCFKKASSLDGADAQVWSNKGVSLNSLERYDDAKLAFQKALSLSPSHALTWFNLGITSEGLGQLEGALSCYDKAIEFDSSYAAALSNKGLVLKELRRYDEAILCFDQAIQIAPEYKEAFLNKGAVLYCLQQYDAAQIQYENAIKIAPNYVDAWLNLGELLNKVGKNKQAVDAYFHVREINPETPFLMGKLLHQKMLICDWSDIGELENELHESLLKGKKVAEPFGYQGISNSEDDLKRCAEIYAETNFPPSKWMGPGKQVKALTERKIRVGYLCGEFREQATSILMAGVYECHDKDRFEIFAFDNGWDDGGFLRSRIVSAFNEIVDISKLSDEAAASEIRDRKVDILVNLNGYFGGARQSVFALRAAPIQVNYLGFPGTIGADYIDYLIADRIVIPESSRHLYTEKVVYLPYSYQANDNKRQLSPKQFSRSDFSLPEGTIVFCCFNNNYKITPEIFSSWMNILKKVEKSVLWLLEDNPWAKENLRKEAVLRGVAADRLIFAERIEPAEHLARQRLADLFLDTLPYNAHTTASDALWAGLPLLTCIGTTFPGRVAASLLMAVDMPELVVHSSQEYEDLAVNLGNQPEKLKMLREKLANNQSTTPLFDTAMFTRDLESAYREILEEDMSLAIGLR